MKKEKIIVLLILFTSLLVTVNVHAKKLAVLNDYYKDPFLIVDNDQFYVWDRALRKVYIYYRENFKKVAEFGKRGEGPGEFTGISWVSINEDFIFVSSYPKICIFDKKGNFKKQVKGPTNAGAFKPFGNNYVGVSYPYTDPYDKECEMLFGLFNSNLKKKKDIYLAKTHRATWPGERKENVLWIRGCTKAVPYKDKLVIGSTYKGFYFAVFDLQGDMLCEINRNYEKRKVTEDVKSKRINEHRRITGEQEWKKHKMMYNIVFSEYFPAYTNFVVDDNKIYVFLFPKDGTEEVLILDLKGKLLKKVYFTAMNSSIIDWGRFSIRDGKLLYVDENFDEETWELHEIDLN